MCQTPERRATGIAVALSLSAFIHLPLAAQLVDQGSADGYTRYELLDPGTHSFRILYRVTADSPGASVYYNPIRRGSEPTVHKVVDRASGKELPWSVVDGDRAAADGIGGLSPDGQYIRVELARPVSRLELAASSLSPAAGERRLLIDKTYRDPDSYRAVGDKAGTFEFERSLGVRRNAIVLPPRTEIVSCSVPVQVALEEDGRLRLSFLSTFPGAADVRIVGRTLPASTTTKVINGVNDLKELEPIQRKVPAGARTSFSFAERAFQDREIVYFLEQPETHSFRLFHDYTETRPGVSRYLNVVRAGSSASDPEAWNIDTGERLKVETLKGQEIRERRIDIGDTPTDQTELVLISFEPVEPGATTRLRIEETYTDEGRYGIWNGELLWDPQLRPRSQRRCSARRMVVDHQRGPGTHQHPGRRPAAPRLRQPKTGHYRRLRQSQATLTGKAR